MAKLILFIHAGATLYMVGLIWFVQVVHYPLFDGVDHGRFAQYERRHTQRTSWVVLPPMVVELACAAALLVLRPDAVPHWMTILGLALVALIWAVTFGLSVPQHHKLLEGFDAQAHRRLVGTNWLRTAAWSLRGGLALWMLALTTRG